MLKLRQDLDALWNGRTEQDVWGIGQVIAPFVWVPLLVDMLYSGVGGIQKWRRGRVEAAGPREGGFNGRDIELRDVENETATL